MSYGLGFSFEVWVCRSVWYFHCRSTAGPGSINTFLVSTDLAYGNTSRRCNWYHVFLTKAETNDKKHIKIAVLDHMYICTDGRFRWLKSR